MEDLVVSVPLGTSDHNTIVLKTNVSVETTCPAPSTSYFDFEHADYDAINEYLAVADWNDNFSHSVTVEYSWCLFTHILNDIFVSYLPVKTTEVHTGKPKRKATRYPRYIRQMQKRKAILWKRWGLSRSPGNKFAYSTAAVGCKTAINKFHAARVLALIRKNNLGSFYKLVNSKIKSNLNGSALRTANGTVTSDPGEKSEIFNHFFSEVFTRDNSIIRDVVNRTDEDSRFDAVLFTPNVVTDVLRTLKPTTSASSDGIPNVFIKNCANFLALPPIGRDIPITIR